LKRFLVSLKMVILTYARSRGALFFGLVFPATLYILYGYVFKGTTDVVGGGKGTITAPLWLLPSILTWSLVLMGITGTIQMVQLRGRGALRVVQTTSMPAIQYVLALVVTQLLFVVAQVALALVLGGLVFHVYPEAGGWYIDLGVILLGAGVFIALGQLIAISTSQVQTANILNQIVNLATIFFCNLFLPMSSLPDAVQKIGHFLPGYLVIDVLRPAVITGAVPVGTTGNNVWFDLAGLAVYLVVFFAITVRFFKWA
jgi:ABC-2 type transport system permease protein